MTVDELIHDEVMALRKESATDATRPDFYRDRIDAWYKVRKALVAYIDTQQTISEGRAHAGRS